MIFSQDCLDRTNVVQCAFAKHVASKQLRSIGVLGEKEQIDDHEDFMAIFRNGSYASSSLNSEPRRSQCFRL